MEAQQSKATTVEPPVGCHLAKRPFSNQPQDMIILHSQSLEPWMPFCWSNVSKAFISYGLPSCSSRSTFGSMSVLLVVSGAKTASQSL